MFVQIEAEFHLFLSEFIVFNPYNVLKERIPTFVLVRRNIKGAL